MKRASLDSQIPCGSPRTLSRSDDLMNEKHTPGMQMPRCSTHTQHSHSVVTSSLKVAAVAKWYMRFAAHLKRSDTSPIP